MTLLNDPIYLIIHHISLIVNIVDVRFGRRDAEDHLFIRIGDDWNGDKKSGLIYGHVSLCTQVIPVGILAFYKGNVRRLTRNTEVSISRPTLVTKPTPGEGG